MASNCQTCEWPINTGMYCSRCQEAMRQELIRLRIAYDVLGAAFQHVRDTIHALPDPLLDPLAKACRESKGPCWCGCHLSEVQAVPD